MIFIETRTFSKLLSNYLSDDEYRGLQAFLLQNPDAGSVVRGSGGIRKVRWSRDGKGKSGGVRVIYYWEKSDSEIWMLTIYAKSERATISGHELKRIWEAINRAKS
ncbi:MAG: type II toxin-antitoxin system RelE/ParE family toxin [Gammaproteobacteria bacterium]|nr:type II toxin-antitoxin system RelE/ParE family toxin [Gammaproteobacteria bacterium]